MWRMCVRTSANQSALALTLQISTSVLRLQVSVAGILCALMCRGPSFVPVPMDSTLQLASCGWLGPHFAKVSRIIRRNC